MSIRSGQNDEKSNLTTGFFLNKQKPFLRPVFNQPRCHGNSTHLSQNARINTSVVSLDSCTNRAPKHKLFKSNGKLGIGTFIFGDNGLCVSY